MLYGIRYYWHLLFAQLHVHVKLRRECLYNCIGGKSFYRIGPVIYWPVFICRWFVIGELYSDNRKEK
jgi:hypothetical protein